MPGLYYDRVKETTTSSGSSNITLAGAVVGYQSFNASFGTSVNFTYCIEAIDASGVPTGSWEVGTGYLSGGATLVRAYISASSNANNAVDLASGTTKNVFATWSADNATDVVGTDYFEMVNGTP
jgi:hypothetical protein